MDRCRFCGQKKKIFEFCYEIEDETESGKTYKDIVEHFCRVKINSDKSISQVICENCRITVENFNDFASKYIHVQSLFKDEKKSFNLHDFKRIYSNEEKKLSIEYLFDNFDSDNYSIWYSEYIEQKDLKKIFMSCNLIHGMLGHLETLRDQAFASICVFGEDNDNNISSVWIWKGQDLVFERDSDWQYGYDSFDWKKLKLEDEETKELLKQYLNSSGCDRNSRRLNRTIIFK
jgi:Elongation factor 1 gamma, conserved domain/Zinc-finger associated domain (zf-AD)